MSASEAQLQAGAQTVMQDMYQFRPQSIVINDPSIFDEPIANSPFVMIVNANDVDSRQDTVTATNNYILRFWLIADLASKTWKEAQDDFRDYRQAIIDKFNEVGTNRSLGGIESVNVVRIYSLTEIGEIYQDNVDPEMDPDAVPMYIAQFFAMEVEQF